MGCTIGRCEICMKETHSPENCGLWSVHQQFKQAHPFKKVYMHLCKECAEQLKDEFAEDLFKDDERINNWIDQARADERAKVAEIFSELETIRLYPSLHQELKIRKLKEHFLGKQKPEGKKEGEVK